MGQSSSSVFDPRIDNHDWHGRSEKPHSTRSHRRTTLSKFDQENIDAHLRPIHKPRSSLGQAERPERKHRDRGLQSVIDVDVNANKNSHQVEGPQRRKHRDRNSQSLKDGDANTNKNARQAAASAWTMDQKRRDLEAPKNKSTEEQKPQYLPRSHGSNSKSRERSIKADKPRSHLSSNHKPEHKSKSKSRTRDSIVNAQATEHNTPKVKKDCMICAEPLSLRRFPSRPPTTQCEHEVNTCRHCLRVWIKSEFRSKVWNQIDCPECRARLTYEDIGEFAEAEVFRRYDKLSTRAAMEAIPGFRWCITKGCKSGQVHDEGSMTPKFKCVSCKKTHCIVHQIPWHKGETCAQYDYRTDTKIKKAEEKASRKWLKSTAKKCPGCSWGIEKRDGCDHMTCTKCKHQFCWLCLAVWGPIRDQGALMHRTTCRMHPNTELDNFG